MTPHSGPETGQKTGRARPVRPRNRRLVSALTALVALAVVGVGIVLVRKAAHTLTTSTQGRPVTTSAPIPDAPTLVTSFRLPATPAALLVVKDASGQPAGINLLAVSSSGKGGTLVVLPTGLQLEPGKRLDAAFAANGATGLVQAVELGLMITVAAHAELTPDELATLITPLAPVRVRFEDAVRTTTTDGNDAVVRPAGDATLSALDVAAVLAAHTTEQSELARLPRTVDVWRALLAPRSGAGAPAGLARPAVDPVTGPRVATVADALGALGAGPTSVQAIAVEAEGATGAGELLVADTAAVRMLMAEIVPGALSPVNGNPRLRIVNPGGDAKVSLEAVRRLVFVGANIVLVDQTTGAVPAVSTLELPDRRRTEEMNGYRPALGALEVKVAGAPIDGIDATITLGADFAKLAAEQPSAGTVASSSTTTATSTSEAAASKATTTTAQKG